MIDEKPYGVILVDGQKNWDFKNDPVLELYDDQAQEIAVVVLENALRDLKNFDEIYSDDDPKAERLIAAIATVLEYIK